MRPQERHNASGLQRSGMGSPHCIALGGKEFCGCKHSLLFGLEAYLDLAKREALVRGGFTSSALVSWLAYLRTLECEISNGIQRLNEKCTQRWTVIAQDRKVSSKTGERGWIRTPTPTPPLSPCIPALGTISALIIIYRNLTDMPGTLGHYSGVKGWQCGSRRPEKKELCIIVYTRC